MTFRGISSFSHTKKEAEPEHEQDVLRGPAQAKWQNRPGSAKERLRMKWATQAAERSWTKMPRLPSRLKRLLSRQQDRQTCKEIVEGAERAAEKAAEGRREAHPEDEAYGQQEQWR